MADDEGTAPVIEVRHAAGTVHLHVESTIGASVEAVWAAVTTFAGVNAELMPYCRMREPRALRGRTLESYRPGERAVCWLLAGGVVPFDRHVLGLASITPGEGFVEESTTWLQRRWRHERTLTPAPGARPGTTVVDHLTVQPRLRFAAPLTAAVLARVFRHRHRRLRAHFAG